MGSLSTQVKKLDPYETSIWSELLSIYRIGPISHYIKYIFNSNQEKLYFPKS